MKTSFLKIKKVVFIFLGFLFGCTRVFDAVNPTKLAPVSHETPIKVCETKQPLPEEEKTILPSQSDILSLSNLIDIGLKNNPNTTKTWAEARQAAAIYGQSLSQYFPQLDTAATYIKQRQSVVAGPLNFNFTQVQITPELQITYVLFDFGQRNYASKSALEALHYANLTHNREIQTVLQTIVNDYFDYLYQKQVLIADEADLLSAQATLDAAEEKKKAGVTSIGDVIQAKTQYLQTKIAHINQRRTLTSSYGNLATDVGIPANYHFRTHQFPEKTITFAINQSVCELIDTAKNKRQDYLASKANVRSKEFSIKSAEAQKKPTLTGYYDIGKTWFGWGHPEKNYHYTAEVGITYPLFHGFYFENGVRKARGDLKQAQAELKSVELTMIQQITTAKQDVDLAAQTLEASEEYLKAAEERYKISLSNYKHGTETVLDTLSSQSSLADARSQLASAKKQWYTSLSNLAYVTGTLDKTLPQTLEKK